MDGNGRAVANYGSEGPAATDCPSFCLKTVRPSQGEPGAGGRITRVARQTPAWRPGFGTTNSTMAPYLSDL